jgi:hypothetical protein
MDHDKRFGPILSFFTVAIHELGIYRDPDNNGTSGPGLLLTLISASLP